MRKPQYLVRINKDPWSDWGASVPDLPGCVATGKTLDTKHLGTIRTPELPANFAFGDEDGRTLYMTARTGLFRMRLLVEGIRPAARARTAAR